MAIEKLDKTFINAGETGYEEVPINADNLNDVTSKIDEIIDSSNTLETSIEGLESDISEMKTSIDTLDESNLGYGLIKVGTISNLSSFDDVASGGALQNTFIGSVCVSSTWYHLINVRHRNGGGTDGTNYGFQIRVLLNGISGTPQYRLQSGDTWSSWTSF